MLRLAIQSKLKDLCLTNYVGIDSVCDEDCLPASDLKPEVHEFVIRRGDDGIIGVDIEHEPAEQARADL